ncbi:hypothetical protein ACJX0J_022043 [Zea mays]
MSKENKATSHTPLIDHHYKTYHHSKVLGVYQSTTHHLAFCCPIGSSTKNITADLRIEPKNITEKLWSAQIEKNITEKLDMEYKKKIAKEGEKKGGTKGKIVMKIMLYLLNNSIIEDAKNCFLMNQDRAHCNMLVTQAFFCEAADLGAGGDDLIDGGQT